MAQTNGTNVANLKATPFKPISAALNGGRVRAFVETVTLASQASGDTIIVGQLPAGAVFLGIAVNVSATLGTSTLAFGDGTTAAKFGVAGTYTATNVLTWVAVASAFGLASSAAAPAATTDIVATIAVAALPGAGTLNILTLYSLD
jgi:hypothetical protein